MKRIFILILFVVSIVVNANTYYVAPTGTNGSYPTRGTFANPWATFQYAFDNITAGDTVYFRGGVYYITSTQYKMSLTGTSTNPICLFNYPGEVPIIDGINATSYVTGIMLEHAYWVHIKGITIRNCLQINPPSGGYDTPAGIYLYRPHNCTIENCVAHDIGYRGFYVMSPDTVYIINCDAYNIIDYLSDVPGNHGDGFLVWDMPPDTTCYAYISGCRAWQYCDTGFDVQMDGRLEVNNCWAFNPYYDDDLDPATTMGTGFAYGYPAVQLNTLRTTITNSIAAYVRKGGFASMDQGMETMKRHYIYNNFAYGGRTDPDNSQYGFSIGYSPSPITDEIMLRRVYRNNIAYGFYSENCYKQPGAVFTESNNTWVNLDKWAYPGTEDNPSLTVTNDDFVSLDWTQLQRPRKADNSLPDITFGHLAPGSDLIDGGTAIIGEGVVLTDYSGTAPDLGWAEYAAADSTANDIIGFTLADQTGAVTAVETILGDTSKTWTEYNVENAASLVKTGDLVSQVKNARDLAGALGNRKLTNINHGLTPTITANEGLLFDGSTALNGYDLDYIGPADIYVVLRQNEWTVNKRPFELNHDSGVLIYNYLIYDTYKCIATYFGGVSGPRTNLMTSQWVLLKISINGTSIKIQINDRNLESGSCGTDANWRQIAFGGGIFGEPFNKINLLRAIFRTGGDDAATAKKISDRLQYEYRDKLAITPDTHENAAVCILGDSLSWYLGHYHLMDEYSTSYLAEGGVGTLLQKFMWDQQTYSLQASFQYIFCMMSVNDQNLTVEQYTTIYQAFINQLRLEAPNAIIIGVELTPVKGCLTHFAGDDGYAKYLTFNEAIRGEGTNALTGFDHILTSHNDILDDGTGALKPEYDGGDHLHLTEAGYTVIANKYKEFIV